MEERWAEIKPGLNHQGGKLQGGDVFLPTEAEWEAFGDKFLPADPPVTEMKENAASEVDVSEVDASEAARNAAEEAGIDLRDVEGSGKDGKIVLQDVKAAMQEQAE